MNNVGLFQLIIDRSFHVYMAGRVNSTYFDSLFFGESHQIKDPCDSFLDFPKPSILYCIRFGGLVPVWVNGIGGGGLRGKYGVMGVGGGVGGLIGY